MASQLTCESITLVIGSSWKMEKLNYLFFLFLFVFTKQCESARILAVLPMPSISHQVVFRPLTQELARRGHELVVITTDPVFPKGHTPPNFTEIDLHDISYASWRKALVTVVEVMNEDIMSIMEAFEKFIYPMLTAQFQSFEVQKLLNETNEFDLIITESIFRPALIFSHIYKAPVIQISSLGPVLHNNEAMGMPTHPILYPSYMSKKIYNLTRWEKVKELYDYFRVERYFGGRYVELEDSMLRQVFGADVPSVKDLNKNVDMLFLNIHPMWEGNIPVPPGVIHIWGIHKRPEKELPEDLKSYLDSSKNGVIYMSFGTNVFPSILPKEKIQAFIKVFSELPYDILWKWDEDELPGRTENIRIGKWFPQSDLLKHPKIKLFITQGGLQSTEEAINAGVPLVGIPILGDQWYNVERYQNFKIGKKLDILTVTEHDFRNAVQTVLEDDSYRKNMIKLRTIMRDEPESALERAVWWTEYVLRHKGAKHLRAAGANLSCSEYYEIPLISTVIISIAIVSLAILFVARYVINNNNYYLIPRHKQKKN